MEKTEEVRESEMLAAVLIAGKENIILIMKSKFVKNEIVVRTVKQENRFSPGKVEKT